MEQPKSKLTRRRFTFGIGAALASAPFAASLLGATPAAGHAKRLVIFFSPNGTVHKHWRPSGSGASYAFAAGSILEPLAAHKSNLLLLDGIDFKGANNHAGGMQAMLTGGGDISVDQYIANELAANTRFASLELGVQTSAWGGNVQTRMSYRGAGQYAPPNDDPLDVFRRLYPSAAGGSDADALLARRKSVLDAVRGDLAKLRGWVGSEQRVKLDAHLASVRQLETTLAGGSGSGDCSTPPATPQALAKNDNANFPAITKLQLDMMVAALACDMTRVASIQLSHTVGPPVFSWLNISQGHHQLSHMPDSNSAGVADFVKAERWFAEQFAYLLTKLEATADPGGGGTLLDTSVVLWAKELGDGRLHTCESVPFIVAGKAGGYLSPGRYLRFSGESHTKLLVSLCHAMGLSNATFGNAAAGAGPLSGLSA
ncbi:MAG: DUF1552 domain-containing protein [Myxococcales bacterium]|nr:DUF1552 domain-containing protein [Myxococcales bacterium]